MNNSKFSRVSLALLSACLLFACSLFVSCKEPHAQEDNLVGTWTSAYGDGYVITDTKITYNDGGYGFDWKADIADISDDYIYVKKYSSGKYYCVAYKNLTETACSFSNAYKDGGKSDCETLDEAKSEFTIENGYFAYYSECSKVE